MTSQNLVRKLNHASVLMAVTITRIFKRERNNWHENFLNFIVKDLLTTNQKEKNNIFLRSNADVCESYVNI